MIFLVLLAGCVEPYPPPGIKPDSQFVVVDAFLNATSQTINVKLTRSVPLDDKENSTAETNAVIFLEEENGSKIQLDELGGGSYAKTTPLNPVSRYRISLTLQSGKAYFSDYTKIRKVPPIDAINIATTDYGLAFQVSAHDPAGKTNYYMWQYDETWEYTSAYQSSYTVDPALHYPLYRDEDIYHCWQNASSTEILIASTARLNEDVVSRFALTVIPKGSAKLNHKYSILVKQIALDEPAFQYWQLLKKNTESLGGLFDPLPSQVQGNIYSQTDPGETVLGYFSASAVAEKRFTISLFELPQEYQLVRQFPECELLTVRLSQIPKLPFEVAYLIVSTVPEPPGADPNFYYSTKYCSDCRLQGGTTNRPDYW